MLNLIWMMTGFIFAIICKYLYDKNTKYSIIINEFNNKLPRESERSSKISKIESEDNSSLSNFDGFDTSTHKPSIIESDINIFLNMLDNIDYKFVIYQKHYKKITNKLQKLDKVEDGNPDLVMIQKILDGSDIGFWGITWNKIKDKFNNIKSHF